MYTCATSKWGSGSPRSFDSAITSLMDTDSGHGKDEWV